MTAPVHRLENCDHEGCKSVKRKSAMKNKNQLSELHHKSVDTNKSATFFGNSVIGYRKKDEARGIRRNIRKGSGK